LVEILVSVFVLGLGVIGAAAMLLSSVRTTQQSRFQSNAVRIASEMADKMRANTWQMNLPDEQNPFLAVNYAASADGIPEQPAKQCYADECDANELARFDISDLQKQVKDMLPSGRVMICRDAEPWDVAVNAYKWECDGRDGKGAMVIKLGWQGKALGSSVEKSEDRQVRPGVVFTVLPSLQ
jgi:type IV pilus assembly protein PilV